MRSVAVMNGYGSRDEALRSAAQEMLVLTAAARDRGLSFRHFPQCTCADLIWQAGREQTDVITLPDGNVRLLHRFELCGWGRTIGELLNQLA